MAGNELCCDFVGNEIFDECLISTPPVKVELGKVGALDCALKETLYL
jgi:hypothetical protein